MALNDVVIDTQVLVWSLAAGDRLTPVARAAIENAPRVYVSVASLYEIEFKRRRENRRGIITILHRLPDDLPARLPTLGLVVLDITAAIARQAARLDMDHGDPWDRIILSHAIELGTPLISSDQRLRQFAGDTPVIW